MKFPNEPNFPSGHPVVENPDSAGETACPTNANKALPRVRFRMPLSAFIRFHPSQIDVHNPPK
jgi:hypothetical protein